MRFTTTYTPIKQALLAILLVVFAFGLTAQVRKYSNAFLNIGVGGRGLGMSGAQVATVHDVTAGYWNPAGLTRNPHDLQFSFMHAEYFADIANYDYGAVTVPLQEGNRHVGLSLLRFAIDDIPNTLHLKEPDGSINYNKIRSFSAADYGLLFSYAQLFPDLDNLRGGANFKIIHRNVGSFANAWGIGLDVGAQYDYQHWKFGVMARDVTSTFNAWSFHFTETEKAVLKQTGNAIPTNSLEITPPKLILGAAYQRQFFDDRFSVMPEINFNLTTDGKRNVLIPGDPFSIDPYMGIELGYSELIFLRGGIQNIQHTTNEIGQRITIFQPNLGVGVHINRFTLDYALTNIGNQGVSLYSHIFSLRVDINKAQ